MQAALLILQAIQAALAVVTSQQAQDIVDSGKGLIGLLFGSKLITKEQQDACFAYCDGMMQMVLQGMIPDHWKVAPDPTP